MRAPAQICALIAILVPAPVLAQDALPPAFQTRIDQAAADCAAADGGQLTVPPTAVTRPDLNGDGTPDWALDEGALQCSTFASLFCGSGGCSTDFLIDGTESSIFGYGWAVVQVANRPVLVVQTGGVDCGKENAAPCARAMIWDQGGWNTQPAP